VVQLFVRCLITKRNQYKHFAQDYFEHLWISWILAQGRPEMFVYMFVNWSTFPARAQVHEVCHSLRCHDTYVAVAFRLQFIGGILYVLETKVNVRAIYYVLMHWQCANVRQILYDFFCVCVYVWMRCGDKMKGGEQGILVALLAAFWNLECSNGNCRVCGRDGFCIGVPVVIAV
jgi:hypothetical protein